MPLFIEQEDVEMILDWLRVDPNIAIIIDCSYGEGKERIWKWQASKPPKFLKDGYYQIWHTLSGKIYVEGQKRNDPDWIEVNNPFEEYAAYPYNNNWELQNVGNRSQFLNLKLGLKI